MPAPDLKFKKTEELSVVFQVYGVKFGDDKKPDVPIEYMFYQKDAGGEKPFNRTPPQTFNGQTLPPNFDPGAGPPDRRRAGRAARELPGRRFPAGNQDHGQQGRQEHDARRAVLGRSRVLDREAARHAGLFRSVALTALMGLPAVCCRSRSVLDGSRGGRRHGPREHAAGGTSRVRPDAP